MYIRVTRSASSKSSAKVYLVEGYKDKDGKVKQRIIKSYGNLDELEKEDPNILRKLKEEAKLLPKNTVTLNINMNEENSKEEDLLGYGYFFLENIYNSLRIPEFLKENVIKNKAKYDLNNILKLLTFSRVLNPASKKETIEKQNTYFENFNVKLEEAYKSLSDFDVLKEKLQLHLHNEVIAQYNSDCTLVFYDVTNYYFEINYSDEDYIDEETGEIIEGLRKNGVSKENRQQPIVAMGLILDKNGLPIGYKLFKGNTSDCKTLIPVIEELKKLYNIGKIVVTADKGLNSGSNLAYLSENEDGYIVSQKIRGSKQEFIDVVLEEIGYVYSKDKTYKSKSIIQTRTVKNEEGKSIEITEKVLIFWSKDYDDRMKYARRNIEKRIEEYRQNPSKFKASNTYGIKRYLKEEKIDKKTGEKIKTKSVIKFDEEKYKRDVTLDGFYAIVTSELEMSNDQILERYRGLSKIEESFRIIKSDLEGRPVHVTLAPHINSHFLICYIALLISRILELKLENKFSVKQIQEGLNSAKCIELKNGIYRLKHKTDTLKVIEEKYMVSLDKKYVTIEELRRYKNTTIKN